MTTTPRTFRSKKQHRQQVQYLAKTVQPLSDWGHGPGHGHKAPKTRRKKRPQGTGGKKYLMQRIARDHPRCAGAGEAGGVYQRAPGCDCGGDFEGEGQGMGITPSPDPRPL